MNVRVGEGAVLKPEGTFFGCENSVCGDERGTVRNYVSVRGGLGRLVDAWGCFWMLAKACEGLWMPEETWRSSWRLVEALISGGQSLESDGDFGRMSI